VAAAEDSIRRTFDLRPSTCDLRLSTDFQPTFNLSLQPQLSAFLQSVGLPVFGLQVLRVEGSLCQPCRLQATSRREPRQPILQWDRPTLIDIHYRRNRRAHRRADRFARSTRAKPRSSMTARRCTSSNYVSISSCQSSNCLRRRVPREIENKRCQRRWASFRGHLVSLCVLALADSSDSRNGHPAA
jgi:hypothetical protein